MATDPLTAGLSAVPASTVQAEALRYADIGINLSDPIYRGIYNGKKAHEDDLVHVVSRALKAGCRKLMITGSDLAGSRKAIEISKAFPGLCYATVGVHPCSAGTFRSHPGGPSQLISDLRSLAEEGIRDGTVTAFGEIGLDYDRLQLCDKETQIEFFKLQLDLAVELQLPLFLHSRAAADDFEALLGARLEELPKRGCVHSFTGTKDELDRIVKMGFDVGINGCSLKTQENLDVTKQVPLQRLQIETDGPWCEIRPSHASSKYLDDGPELPRAVKKEKWGDEFMVKGRNEPCTIGRVAHVVAKVKGISVEEVSEAYANFIGLEYWWYKLLTFSSAWRNSIDMFGLGENAAEGS